jgi:TonB family protein
MKLYSLFLLCFFFVSTISAQTASDVDTGKVADNTNEYPDDVIYVVVEHMPEFPDGQQALLKFLGEQVKYPKDAEEQGIEGRTICQFVIEKDGSISDVVAVRTSGNTSLDKEAIRVLQSMPNWKPGLQRGKPIRVKYTIPIFFRLPEKEANKDTNQNKKSNKKTKK